MKVVLNVIGIVVLLVGGVWALQGLKVLRYGAMVGHRRWIALGALLVIVGVVILLVNNLRKKAAPSA